jgi:hypothetical protein
MRGKLFAAFVALSAVGTPAHALIISLAENVTVTNPQS